LLYSAHFTAYDALFRFPVGSGILIQYPDGRSENLLFGPDGDLKINSLARGLYTVTVMGASGMAPPTPLAMSRNQIVELLVFSHLDMTVLLGFGVVLALGLLFYGRPYLFKMLITLPSHLIPKRRARRVERTLVLESINTPASLSQCKFCRATTKQIAAGSNPSGSQRYRCHVCGKIYTPTPTPSGYSSEIRVRAMQMYIEGSSMQSIGRALKISPRTVRRWVARDLIKSSSIPKSEPTAEHMETAKRYEQYVLASD
jgi:transposase-like protein